LRRNAFIRTLCYELFTKTARHKDIAIIGFTLIIHRTMRWMALSKEVNLGKIRDWTLANKLINNCLTAMIDRHGYPFLKFKGYGLCTFTTKTCSFNFNELFISFDVYVCFCGENKDTKYFISLFLRHSSFKFFSIRQYKFFFVGEARQEFFFDDVHKMKWNFKPPQNGTKFYWIYILKGYKFGVHWTSVTFYNLSPFHLSFTQYIPKYTEKRIKWEIFIQIFNILFIYLRS